MSIFWEGEKKKKKKKKDQTDSYSGFYQSEKLFFNQSNSMKHVLR